jgi:hypothetical protein
VAPPGLVTPGSAEPPTAAPCTAPPNAAPPAGATGAGWPAWTSAGAAAGTGITTQPFSTPYGAAQVSHICLNDGVVEGLRLLDRPAFAVQYHPEAAPGPHDATGLFGQFTALMTRGR